MKVTFTYTINNMPPINISNPDKPYYQDVQGYIKSGRRSFELDGWPGYTYYIYRSGSYFTVTSPTCPGRVLLEGRMTTKKKVFDYFRYTNLPRGVGITDDNLTQTLQAVLRNVLDNGTHNDPTWSTKVTGDIVLFTFRKKPTFKLEAEIKYKEEEVPYHVPDEPKNK